MIRTDDTRQTSGTVNAGQQSGSKDPTNRLKAQERGLFLGTLSLVLYLCFFVLPARYLGIADFSLEAWGVTIALTLLIQTLLWWILRRQWHFVEHHDPHFLHFPVLAASLLFNVYLYIAPGTRLLLLLAWILVLFFAAGRVGLTAIVTWSAIQITGYLMVLLAVREHIAGFHLPNELAHLWMVLGVCIGIGILFERQRRWGQAAREARRRSAATLRESEARLRQVIDLVPHFIFAKDQEGRFILVNRATAEAYGTTIEGLLGKTDADFAPAEQARQFRKDDLEVIRSSQPKVVGEELLTDAQGRQRILHTTKIPFNFADSELPSLLGVAIDITEIKRAEEERLDLEDKMQHLQKLESLGVLAGGVAHDFNNILVSVLGNAELALSDLPEDSAARLRIQRVVTSAERAAELVHQLLAYSGQGRFMVERLDLSRITQGVSDLISASISKKAKVTITATHGDVYVEADPTQLHQVLINLMTNASEALEHRSGRIKVTTGQTRAEENDLSRAMGTENLNHGVYAYLEVVDDGSGMDAKTRARIFEPFFTTKFVGRGLGLAAVLGIVRAHDGALLVDSKPGRGTTVRLLLPLAPPPSRPNIPVEAQDPDLPEGSVLLADDDPAVREFVTEALERAGGSALVATNGAEAIEVYRRHEQDIIVVLLDMTMPEMNGAEALRELRRIRPDIRVILMSGFSEELAFNALDDRAPDGFLQKPFFPETLIRKIQQVLASR